MFYGPKLNKYIFNIFFVLLINILSVHLVCGDEYKVKIIAKVNGYPITSFDLEERLNIFLYEANLERSDINKKKFSKEVLNSLIEEEIKIQEGMKINPNIYQRAELQAQKLIEMRFGIGDEIIKDNLEPYDVSIEHIKRFFTADVLWTSIINARHEREFANVNAKVQKKMTTLNLDLMKNHYKLSEIRISTNNNQNLIDTENIVKEIIQMINQGENFNSIDKKFSSEKIMINYSNLGWVKEGSINEDVLKEIKKTQVGEISKPIKVNESYIIYRLEGQLINGERDERENILELIKLVHPINTFDSNELLKIKEKIIIDLAKISNCKDLKLLHLDYGNKKNVEEAKIQIFNLSNEIRREVFFLSENEFTPPILANEGYVVLMVCKRYLPQIKYPTQEKIKSEIENALFDELSNRYINRLRRASFIEFIN